MVIHLPLSHRENEPQIPFPFLSLFNPEMGSVDLIRSCLDSICQISDEVVDAILYLDAGSSEALQSLGAFPLLLELGARAVCSLENASFLDFAANWNSTSMLPSNKIVCITSRLLSDAHRFILHCLSLHDHIRCCTIFTSISEVAHSAYIDSPLGPDAFREYESLLVQDYEELLKKSNLREPGSRQLGEIKDTETSHLEELNSKVDSWSQLASAEEYMSTSEASCTGRDLDGSRSSTCTEADGWPRLVVSVHHFPMILCTLSPRVFVLPSEGTIGEACISNYHDDALSPGLPAISCNGDDTPPGATLTANFLYHLASKMDLKMEIFSLGDLSKTIGKTLTDMSSLYDVGRGKKSAGLLLIDRSLDLLTPCCHGDSLVDRMLSSLPRRKRTLSSLHVKNPLLTNRHALTKVEHPTLDARIPLGIVLNKNEPSGDHSHLSEGVAAFLSGWTTSSFGSESVSLTDQGDEFHDNSSMEYEFSVTSGSLISNESYLGANYLEALLDRRTKDGALLIKKWLIETIRREKIPLTMKFRLGSVTASELQYLIKLLASKETSLVRNRGIIQLAAAAEIVLSEPHSSRWDAFMSAERILSMSAGDTSQSLSSQIRDLINTSVLVRFDGPCVSHKPFQGLLSFQDALLLAVTGYILAGENFPTSGSNSPFSWEEEHSLKEAIVDAILEMPTPPKFRFIRGLEDELEANSSKGNLVKHEDTSAEPPAVEDFDDQWGSWDDEISDRNDEQVYGNMQLKLELRDRVDNLFKSFHKLSGLKWRNPTLREGLLALERNFGGDIYNKRGLLSKLLTMVLAKQDIPGLEYHSSAVGRFLKSGFGRFGLGQSKPCLGDQNVLLVFVVGGINGLEVFEAQEVVSQSGRPDLELILGGTTLLTPDDMFELLLGSSSYI